MSHSKELTSCRELFSKTYVHTLASKLYRFETEFSATNRHVYTFWKANSFQIIF